MKINDHLEWNVIYEPGILEAHGFKNGEKIISSKVETTKDAAAIQLSADRTNIYADDEDVSVITVQVNDENGLIVPTAENNISFSIEGPGKIIGIGNGNPSSHEKEKYISEIKRCAIENLKELTVDNLVNRPETAAEFNSSLWKKALEYPEANNWQEYKDSLVVIRGTFELPDFNDASEINLFAKSIVDNQSIFINGKLIAANIKRDTPNQSFRIDKNILKTGANSYSVTGKRFRLKYQWDEPNKDPGLVQIIYPAAQWNRKVFSGLAQIIVQSTKLPGEIILKAESNGLKKNSITIKSNKTFIKPYVE
jgi:beta-galactosidase